MDFNIQINNIIDANDNDMTLFPIANGRQFLCVMNRTIYVLIVDDNFRRTYNMSYTNSSLYRELCDYVRAFLKGVMIGNANLIIKKHFWQLDRLLQRTDF